MENEHGPCALADDEVSLPMAGLGSGVDSLRPFMDGDSIFDRISRGPRSARTPAFVTAREITPKLFGLLVSAIDKGVDRLATHRPQTAFISRFQPTRDLLGRPSFRKTTGAFCLFILRSSFRFFWGVTSVTKNIPVFAKTDLNIAVALAKNGTKNKHKTEKQIKIIS